MAKVQDRLEEDQNESVICFQEGAKPLIEAISPDFSIKEDGEVSERTKRRKFREQEANLGLSDRIKNY